MASAPPFVYSKVTGIQSPTGVETEGWLISVGGTPREIMSHSPEFTYRRLLDAAGIAKSLGAQIMGLGAFTKVVGDALTDRLVNPDDTFFNQLQQGDRCNRLRDTGDPKPILRVSDIHVELG